MTRTKEGHTVILTGTEITLLIRALQAFIDKPRFEVRGMESDPLGGLVNNAKALKWELKKQVSR